MHLGCAPDPDQPIDRWRLDAGRPGHERHQRPAPTRLLGDRKPHPPARAVADVANRVDVLVGRSGRDQHATATKRRVRHRGQQSLDRLHDLRWLREPALPHPSAGQIPLAGLDEPDLYRHEGLKRAYLNGQLFDDPGHRDPGTLQHYGQRLREH